ncbi:Helicase associated domain protein [Adhaeribacter swui]|uniref:Helicase associated domain protein n=1 Tax=Adhaeribacter swui TaxID=2086471 RepID=A0A7G7GDP6_9BACT|nr:helicase associated domain-containing protein [Adhaeribacter swui]QNF35280.1 Helicase associated domain protein [Adhaeribacter swui]
MESLTKELFDTSFYESWQRHYHKFKAYLHQDNNEPFNPIILDEDLIKWIGIQARLQNKLPPELRIKLAELPFKFNRKGALWELMYHQLENFFKINGHAHVPAIPEYEALRDWLWRQIQDKKYLSEARFNKLNQLDVDWEMASTRDQRWEQMYARLKEFSAEFGHSLVPQDWKADPMLANWVRVQRRMKAKGKLLPEREKKLNELDFVWHIQVLYNSQWQQYYQELRRFFEKHGHTRVPGRFKQLTSWIENQRTAKKNNLLPANREQKLNDLNFIWNFKEVKNNDWQEKYQQLCAFKKQQGHSFVPVNYKENKSLGTWVATQRMLEAKGKLDPVKKKKLNQIGFVWSSNTHQQLKSNYDSKWNLNFERLKIYQQVYGTCQVSLKINPVLQRWTRWQRILFCQGRLSEERMAKLNEIRFPWNVQEGYWMKMYEALSQFKERYGHTRVPYHWAPNRQLAAWVYRQKLNKAELSAQKIELLNILGFDWSLSRKLLVSWHDMYQRLLQFKQEHGHTRVPVKWAQDRKLGKWVSRMRHEKDKLLPERVGLLEKVDFKWGKQIANNKNEAQPVKLNKQKNPEE